MPSPEVALNARHLHGCAQHTRHQSRWATKFPWHMTQLVATDVMRQLESKASKGEHLAKQPPKQCGSAITSTAPRYSKGLKS